jgi:AmmeMemoRadiSam system protein A
MTQGEKLLLLKLARDSAAAAARGGQPPDIPGDEACARRGGAFVTLKKNGCLRGCIGHFTGLENLCRTVVSMAWEAAVSDPRFPPLSVEELPEISITISVLSPMVRTTPEDVVPGVHGLFVKRGGRGGTLLPQVATEEGWNRETLLEHTCMKAGLHPRSYTEPGTELYAYTAEVFGETEKED